MSGRHFTTGVVRDTSESRVWPSFAELTACVHPRQNIGLFASAPWFCPNGLDDTELMEHYYVAGVTPDGLPRRALESQDWRYHCYLPDRAVARRHTRGRLWSVTEAREALTLRIYQRVARMGGSYPIPPEYGFDTWVFRCGWEAGYGVNLATVLQRASEWRGEFVPCGHHLAFSRPYLVADFRYLRRFSADDTSANYRRLIRWERFQRARTGYLIPYQMIEADAIVDACKAERYVRMPGMWQDWEVPKGLWVELPPVLTYAWSRLLNNPASGVWPVFYAEWCAIVACAWLWELYDSYRLFWLPDLLLAGIRRLNLDRVLGCPCNGRDLSHLLGIIEDTEWSDVPASQRLRQHPAREGSVDYAVTGRNDAGGDWLLYDPWEREFLPDSLHRERRAHKPTRPNNHPRGYVFHRDDIPCGETRARERAMDCDENPSPTAASDGSGEGVELEPESAVDEAVEPESAVDKAAATRGTPRPRRAGDDDVSSSASSFARHGLALLDLGAGISANRSGGSVPSSARDDGRVSPPEAEGSTISAILRSAGLISASARVSPSEAIALLRQLQPAGGASNVVVPDSADAPRAAAPNAPTAAHETDSEPVVGSGGSGTVSAEPAKGD